MGGGAFAGVKLFFASPYLLGIGLFIWLFTTLSTFLYFEQAHIVADAFDDSAKRTALFAMIDFAVNLLTILVQIFVTGRLVERFGLTTCLTLIPVAVTSGFLALGLAPILPVLLAFQVLRRAGNYALTRPAREMLFTVVGREEKYKAKNFVDTVIYRGGDAVSGWVFAGLKAVGLSLSAIAFIAVPIGVLWIATALLLGRKQENLRMQSGEQSTDLGATPG
jgi:AAA family ATP:ADP antiporter